MRIASVMFKCPVQADASQQVLHQSAPGNRPVHPSATSPSCSHAAAMPQSHDAAACCQWQAKKLPAQTRGVELRRINVTQYMGMEQALSGQ